MTIQASVRNAANDHQAVVSTGGQAWRIEIPAKTAGQGSSVNGGELLLLALAVSTLSMLVRVCLMVTAGQRKCALKKSIVRCHASVAAALS